MHADLTQRFLFSKMENKTVAKAVNLPALLPSSSLTTPIALNEFWYFRVLRSSKSRSAKHVVCTWSGSPPTPHLNERYRRKAPELLPTQANNNSRRCALVITRKYILMLSQLILPSSKVAKALPFPRSTVAEKVKRIVGYDFIKPPRS